MNKDFLKGMGSIINLFPSMDEEDQYPQFIISDEEAIRKDWEQVGDDLYFAMEKLPQRT